MKRARNLSPAEVHRVRELAEFEAFPAAWTASLT
jgi:hypothetical protein